MATTMTLAEDRRAAVRIDDEPEVVMTWGMLHEAQQQDGVTGLVYSWMMRQYLALEYAARQGQPWRPVVVPGDRAEAIATIAREELAWRSRDAAERQSERQAADTVRARRAAQHARERELARVEAARRESAGEPYQPIPSWEVPAAARFDVPRREQGQIVEVAYGDFGRSEAGDGSPFMKVTDRSMPSDEATMYYRRVG